MIQQKEITIKQDEPGDQQKEQMIFQKELDAAQNKQSENQDLQIPQIQPFKNISQISVNKQESTLKKQKVKSNKWVLKNRSQGQNKQNNMSNFNSSIQKSMIKSVQIEDQENQIKANSRKASLGLEAIQIDVNRGYQMKSLDNSLQVNTQKINIQNQKPENGSKQDFILENQQQNNDQENRNSGPNTKKQGKTENIQKKYAVIEKGIECSPEIETDEQMLNKLLEENKYRPTKEWKEQFEKDMSELLLGSEVQDKRAVGSLLGITVFGIVGFVASGLNPIGLVAGAVAGGVIGQYAGRKIKKKLLRTKKLLQFDLFTLKLNCYIKFGQELIKPCKLDINTYRFYIEKVVEEMKVAIQYRRFRQKFHKDIKKILEKFLKLLKKDFCFKAILLSYKLTKEIIKRKKYQSNNQPEFTLAEEEQIVDCVMNVLIPCLNILSDNQENLTPILKTFQFKLEKLSKDYVILSLIEKGNHVTSNKNKTFKQIEELDQQLDQEINIEAFERIFNPEHIKQFIIKGESGVHNQQSHGKNDNNIQKLAESGNKHKNVINSQQKKPKLSQGKDADLYQEQSSLNSNYQNNNDLNRNAEDEQRSATSNQTEKKQQRIIDLYIQAIEQRNKNQVSQKKDDENDIGDDESGMQQNMMFGDDVNKKRVNTNNNPSQYPAFSKQHLSKIAQKENIILSPGTGFSNQQDELQEMDLINQKQNSMLQDVKLLQQNSYTSTINQDTSQIKRKISNIQIQFNQLPKKQLDVDQESIKSNKQDENVAKKTNNQMQDIESQNNQALNRDNIELNSNEDSRQSNYKENQQNLKSGNNFNIHFNKEQSRSFARNDNRTFLKMNSDESIFSKNNPSPKYDKQIQLQGDHDQPMKDSIVGDQVIELPQKMSVQRGSIFKQANNQNNNNPSIQQKGQPNFRQSIVLSRDDNFKEEVVVVNIPEIQKEEKMSQSTSKEEKNKLDPQTQEKFDRLISLVQEDPEKTWECVIKKDDIMFIYKKMIPGNPCVLVRAESLIKDCNAEEVFVQIYNAELRSQWDKVTQGFTVIDKLQDGVDIIYFFVDPGLGVTKRDFCQTRVLKKDYPQKGQTTIVFYSIQHPSCPERKGYIRAFSHIAGYVIRPQGKDTSLTIMTQSDVKGIVPKYVVNYMAARAPPKWIESMKKGCIDYRNSLLGITKKKK
ncbi:START domain protein (macronuclear) [Tetrahymena thermophila SB210]|uniref:Phosphatidylcholine transfer protein n=1 Tax=Tetrahymena thermophila (strain SB210) TaxID=312017 RepID=Q23CU9_TETTS|nr:START domain protein [Tetrahymena thermophila SB210]EAR94352.1 START domain protein [Tetrahymena thermophila SB210]|eukprot:XP_001014937.1 START domain protein [Tetrahymena thermophila SB210]